MNEPLVSKTVEPIKSEDIALFSGICICIIIVFIILYFFLKKMNQLYGTNSEKT